MSAQADRALSLGAEVNGYPERVEGVLDDLESILAAPEDAEAALAAIDALGHAWDPRAVRLLVDLVDSADTDLRVREALVRALPCGADDSSVRDDVTDVLIRMSADDAPTVRSWSCFGLGQLNADSGPAVAALAARLADDDLDTRQEAIAALATIGDDRALPACEHELDADPDTITLLTLQTAAELASPALLQRLEQLRAAWAGQHDRHTEALELAIERCQPVPRDGNRP